MRRRHDDYIRRVNGEAETRQVAAMTAGRPSKYREAYCAEVIAHLAEGASLTSFAAEIGVARSTINEWIGQHPEFSEACARAKAKCAAWWEKANRTLAVSGVGNQGACKLGLTNMAADDWREKTLLGSDPDNPLPTGVNVTFRNTDAASGD
jgi:hypothetical protein